MPKVRVLPDIIINKIAAGEVVERPSSIVKELVENSLDASSTRISVDIEDGGKRLIKISDNGVGMEYEDALLAVERHATSKILSDADLFSISTLGFRGEALPSIASVSRFNLETRTKDSDSGVHIQINGGKILNAEDAGCAPGTIISVRDLFFNTPARRKFLKTTPTETAHITEILTCLALPWPSVHFRLSGDGKVMKNLPAVASPFERAVDVLGRDLRNRMLYIERETENVILSGWISEPDITRGSGQKIYVFVNGRYVRDRGIIHAICDAYKGSLMKGRFPVAVLFMDLPHGTVDVNVHPTKQEVRFSNHRDIYSSVRSACHDALMKREASKHGFRQAEGDFIPSVKIPKPKAFEPPIFREYDNRSVITGGSLRNSEKESEKSPLSSEKPRVSAVYQDKDLLGMIDQNLLNKETEPPVFDQEEPLEDGREDSLKTISVNGNESATESLVESSVEKSEVFSNEFEEQKIGPAPQDPYQVRESVVSAYSEPAAQSIFSSLRIIGQFRNSYILCDSQSGLLLFDQHAAHERVVYERLQQMAEGEIKPSSQRLLVPEIVEFSPRETLALLEVLPELVESGIEIEHFGEDSFAVRAVPSLLSENMIRQLLHDIAEKMTEFSGKRHLKEEIFGECFSVMACHAAIRSGQELAYSDMKNLLNDLSKCRNPYHCPHGRPVHMAISLDEMEKRFGRKG